MLPGHGAVIYPSPASSSEFALLLLLLLLVLLQRIKEFVSNQSSLMDGEI